ncbi:hypothetical protein L083_8177 [Actinoplanes sp. N902-109]|nr:hypothetical protein L083_8177 [Actinoplanes sp. N902-109]
MPARRDGQRDLRGRREPDTSWQRELESAAWDRDHEADVWLRDADTGQWHRAEADDDEDDEDDRGDRPRRRRRAPDDGNGPPAPEGGRAEGRRGRRRAPEAPLELGAAPEPAIDPQAYPRTGDDPARPLTSRARELEAGPSAAQRSAPPAAPRSAPPAAPRSGLPAAPRSGLPAAPRSGLPAGYDRPMSGPPAGYDRPVSGPTGTYDGYDSPISAAPATGGGYGAGDAYTRPMSAPPGGQVDNRPVSGMPTSAPPGTRSDERPGSRSDERPGSRSDERPDSGPEGHPNRQRSAWQQEPRPAWQQELRPGTQEDPRPSWQRELAQPDGAPDGEPPRTPTEEPTTSWLSELGGGRQQLGGTPPVSPSTSFGGRASVDPGQPGGWRADAQATAQAESWRSQMRAEEAGAAPSDAVTEIRQSPEAGGKGSANYREGGSTDWRRELKAESNLSDGESRRFGTSDFVPFRSPAKDPAAAAVPAASSAPAGATEVIPRTGASWQDPPDTEWPPRGAVMTSPTGSYERRPVSTLTSASARQSDLLEPDDEIEEDTGGPLAAVGYTVVWYGVPVVLFVIYMLVLDGGQQTHALDTLAKAAPQFGLSLVLSILVAIGLRWASGSWKAASVGLAAAVMGGGLATVLTSAITGQSLS